jgi:hypothetical protein
MAHPSSQLRPEIESGIKEDCSVKNAVDQRATVKNAQGTLPWLRCSAPPFDSKGSLITSSRIFAFIDRRHFYENLHNRISTISHLAKLKKIVFLMLKGNLFLFFGEIPLT